MGYVLWFAMPQCHSFPLPPEKVRLGLIEPIVDVQRSNMHAIGRIDTQCRALRLIVAMRIAMS